MVNFLNKYSHTIYIKDYLPTIINRILTMIGQSGNTSTDKSVLANYSS